MGYHFVVFVCLQALCLQNAYSQSPNRPGCQSQVTVTDNCIQNQPLLNFINQPNIIQPGCQCQQIPQPNIIAQPCQCQPNFIAQPSCQCQPNIIAQPCQCQPNIIAQPSCQCQSSVVAQPSIVAQTSCQPVVANPCDVDYVAQYATPTATIIQDDSIANNLANALQILIVSNLLSNTLPFNDVVNLGVAQPGLLAQPALYQQPALLQQPLFLQQPALLQQPLRIGGCGCGCGCNYIL